MTIASDKKTLGSDIAKENTLGVPLDGFQDPTGEFPKRTYAYGSSVNKAARGSKVNELYLGGGDIGVSLNVEDQIPSQFPFNQVKETSSGHVVEYDDTPGGERILIRHRSGAGVEMRSDGSVILSATNNRVEVTGGDQTVIIEGNGNLVYKGNLNLTVTGDYNVDVGGNYNINVAGSQITSVALNQRDYVSGNSERVTKGSHSTKTVGNHNELYLADNRQITNGDDYKWVEGKIETMTEADMFTSAKKEYVVSSEKTNMTATQMSILGAKGVIGGEKIDFTGQVYMGKNGPTPFTSGATFYGDFLGQALEALKADKADEANKAGTAAQGPAGSGCKVSENLQKIQPGAPTPVASVVGSILTQGSYMVRTVVIDEGDVLKSKILLSDDYSGLFEKIPTTQEIRSTIRDPANKGKIIDKMVAEKRINPLYSNVVPPKIGRTVKKSTTPRFGHHPIGNSLVNRGKRFS